MRERESVRTDRAQTDLQVLIEEIWALGLEGAHEISLRLLEELSAEHPEPAATPAIELLKARLLLRKGSPEGRAEAARSLRLLAEGASTTAWRARLELSRLLRREGKTTEAATVLKQAVDEFRGSPAASGPLAGALAMILTAEAESVHHEALRPEPAEPGARPDPRDRRQTAAPPQIDPSLLLRLIDLG